MLMRVGCGCAMATGGCTVSMGDGLVVWACLGLVCYVATESVRNKVVASIKLLRAGATMATDVLRASRVVVMSRSQALGWESRVMVDGSMQQPVFVQKGESKDRSQPGRPGLGLVGFGLHG